MKALKYCNCDYNQSQIQIVTEEWLLGAVQRGRMHIPPNVVVTAYSSIRKCPECNGSIQIIVVDKTDQKNEESERYDDASG